MATENPIEETPAPETDAQQIERLTAENAAKAQAVNQLSAQLLDARAKAAQDALTIAGLSEQVRLLAEEEIPALQRAATQMDVAYKAQIAGFVDLVGKMVAMVSVNPAVLRLVGGEVIKVLMANSDFRQAAKGIIATFDAQ